MFNKISRLEMYYLSLLLCLLTSVSGSIPSVEVVDKETGGACQIVPVRYNFCEVVPPIPSLLDNGWLLIAEWVDTHTHATKNQWSYFSEVNDDTSPWCTNPFDKGNCGPDSHTFWGCDKKVHQTCVARMASTTSRVTQLGPFRSQMNPILNKNTNTIAIPEVHSVVSCNKHQFENMYEYYICETHSSLKSFYLFQPEPFGDNVAFSLENKSLVVLESAIATMAKKHCPDNKWCSISQSSTESLETFEKGTPYDRMNSNNTVVFFNPIKEQNSRQKGKEDIENKVLIATSCYLFTVSFLYLLVKEHRKKKSERKTYQNL